MINEETVKRNFEKYTEALEKLSIDTESLYTTLNSNIILAPSSLTTEFYGAFDGGLIDYSMRVANYMVRLNKQFPEDMRLKQDSLLRVALLHAISYSQIMVKNKSDWHRKNLGKEYEFRNDLVSMTTGERSAKIIVDSGIRLTDEEYQAILNYNKEDDKQSKYYSSLLGYILKMAITMAIEEGKHILKTHMND